MPPVQGGHLEDAVPFRAGDHRGISDTQREVPVGRYQFGDPKPVPRMYRIHEKGALRQVLGEQDFGSRPQAVTDQIGDLGDDQRRNNEWTGERPQQIQTPFVKRIVAIGKRIQWAGIDHQTWHSLNSAERSTAFVAGIGETQFIQQFVKTSGNVGLTTRTCACDTERAVGARIGATGQVSDDRLSHPFRDCDPSTSGFLPHPGFHLVVNLDGRTFHVCQHTLAVANLS